MNSDVRSVHLRRATSADVEAIRGVCREAYAKWIPRIGREPLPMTADYQAAIERHRFDLILQDGALVGLIQTVDEGDQLLIENLAVAPAFQGRGLGRRLLAHVEALALGLGRSRVRLYTNERFDENVGLYQSLGYGIDRLENIGIAVAVHMSKALPEHEQQGWRIMHAGLEQAQRLFGARIASAFAIGSLAHGGFAPAASDVDLALVLDALHGDEAVCVEQLRRLVQQPAAGELSKRLSVFWSTWRELEGGSGAGRFPLADRHDLALHGRLLAGADARHRIRLPEGDELKRALVREGAEFMLAKLALASRDELLRRPDHLAAMGCREVTKAVLFPARFLYTAAVGLPAENQAAAGLVATALPGPVGELVLAAYGWRTSGALTDPGEVRRLLSAGVVPLHLAMIDGYRTRLMADGEVALARSLEQWAEALGR